MHLYYARESLAFDFREIRERLIFSLEELKLRSSFIDLKDLLEGFNIF
jgi:hypothetical protein